MLLRMWRKGSPCTLLVGMEISAATVETVWKFLKKLKIELSYDPAILGIYLKQTKILIQKEICTSMFTAASCATVKV